jgi:hypothetical protein
MKLEEAKYVIIKKKKGRKKKKKEGIKRKVRDAKEK